MSHSPHSTIIDQQNDIFFGSEVINRVSFLREDYEFINSSIVHPSTRFIFFDNTNPLVNKKAKDKLVILTNGDNQLIEKNDSTVKKGLYLNNEKWKSVIETWSSENREQAQGLRDNNKPTFLFLGLQDESVGLNLQSLKSVEENDTSEERYLDHQGRYQGIPYFAVDLSQSPNLANLIIEHVLSEIKASKEDIFFTHSRKHYLGFSLFESALYSHGKMFLDWLFRNKFCPGCGSKVIPIHAGGKLKCTNDEKDDKVMFKCPVKNVSVSNVSFPRTDAVVITAITNTERTKILLSLSKRYAATKMYACTAGFMEPSETVETATKREIWEETGVVCSKMDIIMTQPWPFPGNLMIGCLGIVEFNGTNEIINLGHDRELADARWFDIDFVRKLIFEKNDSNFNPEGIILPNRESIAYSLIKLVIDQATNNETKL